MREDKCDVILQSSFYDYCSLKNYNIIELVDDKGYSCVSLEHVIDFLMISFKSDFLNEIILTDFFAKRIFECFHNGSVSSMLVNRVFCDNFLRKIKNYLMFNEKLDQTKFVLDVSYNTALENPKIIHFCLNEVI